MKNKLKTPSSFKKGQRWIFIDDDDNFDSLHAVVEIIEDKSFSSAGDGFMVKIVQKISSMKGCKYRRGSKIELCYCSSCKKYLKYLHGQDKSL